MKAFKCLFGSGRFITFNCPINQCTKTMKKFVFTAIVFLAYISLGFGQAPGNGGGNGNGSAGSPQVWPPAIGESSTACGTSNNLAPVPPGGPAPSTLQSWPMNKVVHILQIARPFFPNTNLGQMIQAYNQCSCVITYLGEGYFRVAIGGVNVVLLNDQL